MQYCEQDDNRSGRWGGVIAVVCYIAVLLAVLFLGSFRSHYEQPADILIVDFGSLDDGDSQASGSAGAQASGGEAVPQTSESDSAVTPSGDEITTQNYQEVPEAGQQAVRNENIVESQTVETPQIDPRGLFPGTSSGTNTGNAGLQAQGGTSAGGNGRGEGEGSGTGVGSGSGGAEVSLPGRQLVGRLPEPVGKEAVEGRIVVDITVDGAGSVTQASVRMQGTTIRSESVQKEALDAARRAKFNSAGQPEQAGTITYIFKLR